MGTSCLITHPKAISVEFKFSRADDKRSKVIEEYSKEGLIGIYNYVAKQAADPQSTFNKLAAEHNMIYMTVKPVNEKSISAWFIIKNNNYVKKILKKIKELIVKRTLVVFEKFDRYIAQEYAEIHYYNVKPNTEERYCELKEKLGMVTLDELKCLTHLRLQQLGFNLWSEHDPIRLIPLRLMPLLDPEMTVKSIDGSSKKLKDINIDIRFGCVAYGFYLD
nr:MAG TPA: hypothetical protein [Caudoviricetes sp.]